MKEKNTDAELLRELLSRFTELNETTRVFSEVTPEYLPVLEIEKKLKYRRIWMNVSFALLVIILVLTLVQLNLSPTSPFYFGSFNNLFLGIVIFASRTFTNRIKVERLKEQHFIAQLILDHFN